MAARFATSGLLISFVAACSQADFGELSVDDGESEIVHGGPTPFPPGDDFDGLSGLPVTSETDRLLVSTIDEDRPFLLLDLGAEEVTALPEAVETFTDPVLVPGGAAYLLDDGTVGLWTRQHGLGVLEEATQDDEVVGYLRTSANSLLVIVGTDEGGETPLEISSVVVFDVDGTFRCRSRARIDSLGGDAHEAIWVSEPAGLFDPGDCSVTPDPVAEILQSSHVWDLEAADDGVVFLLEGSTIRRVDSATGDETSRDGDRIWDLHYAAGQLWAIDGADVVLLDANTLERVEVAFSFSCGDGGRFAGMIEGHLYAYDTCDEVLVEIDPDVRESTQLWWIPTDEESDMEVFATSTDNGFRFVDPEQTGVPYFFDVTDGQFERLDLTTSDNDIVYALSFDVSQDP